MVGICGRRPINGKRDAAGGNVDNWRYWAVSVISGFPNELIVRIQIHPIVLCANAVGRPEISNRSGWSCKCTTQFFVFGGGGSVSG